MHMEQDPAHHVTRARVYGEREKKAREWKKRRILYM